MNRRVLRDFSSAIKGSLVLEIWSPSRSVSETKNFLQSFDGDSHRMTLRKSLPVIGGISGLHCSTRINNISERFFNI